MQNVTLRQLEAFLAVAEELHFGRAAERLSVSAPWMSHTVRDLERALRVELLSRTTRTVQVTPAGQVFAGLASQILTELSSAIKTVRSLSAAPRETLKLGYTIGAGLEVVPTLLRTYTEREPGAGIVTEEFDFTDPSAGLRDNLVMPRLSGRRSGWRAWYRSSWPPSGGWRACQTTIRWRPGSR